MGARSKNTLTGVHGLMFTKLSAGVEQVMGFIIIYSPRESEGIFFFRRWFVCLSVTTITKKNVDGFEPNFT